MNEEYMYIRTSTRQVRSFSVVGPAGLEWASVGTAIAPQGSL